MLAAEVPTCQELCHLTTGRDCELSSDASQWSLESDRTGVSQDISSISGVESG